jgi:hypothetical protein
MSVFDLTQEDIETIRASIDRDRVLARRYGLSIEMILHIRRRPVYTESNGRRGKLVHDPFFRVTKRQGRPLHNHTGIRDRPIELDFRSLLHGSSEI